MRVLAIGYGKNLFTAGHPEQVRQVACAAAVGEYHMIVFARTSEGLRSQQIGNFFLYPSGGRTRMGMVLRAVLLGRSIIRQAGQSADSVVTAQDPFEAGLVGYLVARSYQLPLNLQEHGDFFSTVHWRQESIINFCRARMGMWLLRRADTVRVVSKRMIATMQQIGVAPTRLRLLSVEVLLKRFLSTPPSDAARKLFPTDAIIILTVARLVPQKNLSLLLHAFASVVGNSPRARLLIIGAGPEQQMLTTLATELGLMLTENPLVRFLPWTDDVPSYMKSSDIYALSSNYEGYARVLPEAMASGLPIVSTDVGCAHEAVLSGQHGVVVPVGDEVEFTKSLMRIVEDETLRQHYGLAGHKTMMAADAVQPLSYAERWKKALQ